MFNLSAFGCFLIDLVLPMTTPSKPPGMDSYLIIPSTSKPRSVNFSPTNS